MTIDPLTPADAPALEALLDATFGADRHARAAYKLRSGTLPLAHLGLVVRAAHGGLLGSLQCWPVELVTPARAHPLVLLGPVAVAATHRGRGIGTALIDACLARAGAIPMLLIGDEPYYGRFGFSAARTGGWTLSGAVDRARLLARAVGDLPVIGALHPARRERAAA